jgi:hypothetical protein
MGKHRFAKPLLLAFHPITTRSGNSEPHLDRWIDLVRYQSGSGIVARHCPVSLDVRGNMVILRRNMAAGQTPEEDLWIPADLRSLRRYIPNLRSLRRER